MKDNIFNIDPILQSSPQVSGPESHGRLIEWGIMPDNESDISDYFNYEIKDNMIHIMTADAFIKNCSYIMNNALYSDNLFKTRVIDVVDGSSYEKINLDAQFVTEGIIYDSGSNIVDDIKKFLYYYAIYGLIDTYHGELWSYEEALSFFHFICKDGFVLESLWYDKSTIKDDYSCVSLKLRGRNDYSSKIVTIYANPAQFATVPHNIFMDVLLHYTWKVESMYDKFIQLHNKYSGNEESDMSEGDFIIDDYWDEDYGDNYDEYSGEYEDSDEYEDDEEVLYNGDTYHVSTTENRKEGEYNENIIMGSSNYDPYKPAE